MKRTYIALLRAVNVGGANSLPNVEFVQLLEGIRLSSVQTYLQSGNAVFQAEPADSASLAEKIKATINRSRGFAPEVVLLTLEELEAAVAGNPYPEADADPKSVHLTFLAEVPENSELQALERARKPTEQFTLAGKVFYLHAPEGVGRSKLSAMIEKSLGVAGTARNWRTVSKILEIAREVAAAGTDAAAGL